MLYRIDRNSKTPICWQIYGQLAVQITRGDFPCGFRLPTEKDWLKAFGVSKGTVRQAYNMLQRDGLVDVRQGSGTYVTAAGNRRVEETLSQIFDRLTSAEGYTLAEIYQICTQELGMANQFNRPVRIAWIDCTREMLYSTAQQIREHIPVSIDSFVLSDILKSPVLVNGRYDLIVTTENHKAAVKGVASGQENIVSIRPSIANECGILIAKIPPHIPIWVFCESDSYCQYVCRLMEQFEKKNPLRFFFYHDEGVEAFDAPADQSALIVPHDIALLADPRLMNRINQYRGAGGPFIPLQYVIDKGSLLMLSEKVQRLSRMKQESGGDESIWQI